MTYRSFKSDLVSNYYLDQLLLKFGLKAHISHTFHLCWRKLVFFLFRVRYLLHQGQEVQGGLGVQEDQAVQGFRHCQEGQEDPVRSRERRIRIKVDEADATLGYRQVCTLREVHIKALTVQNDAPHL